MVTGSSRLIGIGLVTGMLCLVSTQAIGQEQKQPQCKDQAECDLYNSILQDNNPKTKLDKLQQWESKYPATEFGGVRRTLLLTTHVAANQPREALAVAKKTLADDPKDFNALYYTMLLTQSTYAPGQTAVLDDGEKASKALLANIDTPPPGVTADAWAKLRPDIEKLSHTTLGFIGNQKKNWDMAEAELRKVLELDPNNGGVDYMLYFTLANKKNNSAALFYSARAASYDGPGSLAPAQRQAVLAEVQKTYTLYHGSNDGFNDLLALAKSSPNPPDGFHLKSKAEIAKEKYEAESANAEKFAKEHPEWNLWKSMKEQLTGPGGAEYFNSGVKEAKVLTLKGKVVKLEPAVKPKIILLALEDGTNDGSVADATLKFEAPLPGKVEPGTELSFEGVGESYTANPLMVVFTVDKESLHGWTGKNAPAPVRRPTPKGKSSAKK
jgi:tetratricopeptide (TPR) repeat protein